MDVEYEDRKLHNDGIFDSLMGYKEWFHYLGTFYVKGKPLNFMLGSPMSYTGRGAFGWISFEENRYFLAGNVKDTDKDGFYELQRIPVHFEPSETGYTLWYIAEPNPDKVYKGIIKGKFPEYTFNIQVPDADIEIRMKINSRESIYTKEVFSWMPFKKRFASWFHSGDITASIKGTISGKDITSTDAKNRGWYERMWSKVSVLWPSEWLWFMAHLDNGGVFDLYTAESLGMRVHALDECWVYQGETFHEFSDYEIKFPEKLEKAIEDEDYSAIKNECIECKGKNGEDSFMVTAEIIDFQQYEFHDYSADIKYTNFIFDIEGEAVIGGNTIDMKGKGAAEWAPMLYWWV